jgi:hypothetical protein
VPREVRTVLDLTQQDFQTLSNVTGRIFEIGVDRSNGCLSTIVLPNSDFLKQDLKGKHTWLNAFDAKDLSERVRHTLSACSINPLRPHQAVNAYRHVFVKGFSLCVDCA